MPQTEIEIIIFFNWKWNEKKIHFTNKKPTNSYLERITWRWGCDISWGSSAHNRTASNWTAASSGSTVSWNRKHIDLCIVVVKQSATVIRCRFEINMRTTELYLQMQTNQTANNVSSALSFDHIIWAFIMANLAFDWMLDPNLIQF